MIELLTAALVLITGFYAWVTFRILRANEAAVAAVRDQSERMSRPYISVSTFVYTGSIDLFLRISNLGQSSAEGLRLSLDRQLPLRLSKDLREFWAFQNEIPSFPPGAELLFSLGASDDYFRELPEGEERPPSTFAIRAEYSGGSRRYVETSTIDLRQYLYTAVPRDPIADELGSILSFLMGEQARRDIQRDARRWTGGGSGA